MAATLLTTREVTVWIGRQGPPRTPAWQLALRRAAYLARTGRMEVPFAP